MRFEYRARNLAFFSRQHFSDYFVRGVIIFFRSFIFKWVTQGYKLCFLRKPSGCTCRLLIITSRVSCLTWILSCVRWWFIWIFMSSLICLNSVVDLRYWSRLRFIHRQGIFLFRDRLSIFTVRIVSFIDIGHHLISHNIIVYQLILLFTFLFFVLEHLAVFSPWLLPCLFLWTWWWIICIIRTFL